MIRSSELKGFPCPNREDRIIAALFADDTTVCLSEEDNFADLDNILEVWCKASGAKFNKGKTQVIPIGPKTYRNRVIAQRKLHPDHPELPNHIEIVKDGEAVRILGSWQGNETNQATIWAPTIEKIERSLDKWDKSNPTINGRQKIVQMVVGGMTQYLTTVQGMPKDIEDYLDKRIKTFMWAGKRVAPLNNDFLFFPTEEGGKDLLSIKDRNDAIALKDIRDFLTNEGPDRAKWCDLAKH
jgi:hypothetical protein